MMTRVFYLQSALLILAFVVSSCSAFEIKHSNLTANAVPIAIFHGYGGTGDFALQEYLKAKLNVPVLCVEPSTDPKDAASYSINTPIKIQGASAGDKINEDPIFSGEFDLIGFSQGTIISRYVIQNGQLKGKVRNFVAFGGPLNGQSYILGSFYDLRCIVKNYYNSFYVFTDSYQTTWAPANYWRDPSNFDGYLDKSEFLAEANNERDYSDERKQKFLRLNRAMFIKWDSEQVIKPAESSWWGQYDINYNVLHRNSTDVYQKDLIGIRTLEEQGRAKFVSIPGGHMEFTFEQIDNIIVPFLLGN